MKKVLLVEDDELIRKALAGEVSVSGFSVVEANDGEAALKTLEMEKPDIVVLDLIIPKISGLEVLKKIRDNPATSSLPVIILTNLDTDDNLLKSIAELNPSFYLNKANISLAELPDKIKECLGG